MGCENSKCVYFPNHYGDWADKGQCGTFEMVTYPDITSPKPNSTVTCGTDYDAIPTCTPSMNLLFGSVFAPIIAVLAIVLAWYILFWRSNGSSKVHRVVAFIIISAWSFSPMWLALTLFKDDIDRKCGAGNFLGVFIFTIVAAAATLGFMICYCGLAGVVYLCRSQPSPAPGTPTVVGYGHTNNAYAPLQETHTTPLAQSSYGTGSTSGGEGSVAIAVAPVPSSR